MNLHESQFQGWTWETQSRGAHVGAYDITECGDCPTCLLPGQGRHRT